MPACTDGSPSRSRGRSRDRDEPDGRGQAFTVGRDLSRGRRRRGHRRRGRRAASGSRGAGDAPRARAPLGGLVVSFDRRDPARVLLPPRLPPRARCHALHRRAGPRRQAQWFPSTVGVLDDGRVWPFTGPSTCCASGPLPLVDRVRPGSARCAWAGRELAAARRRCPPSTGSPSLTGAAASPRWCGSRCSARSSARPPARCRRRGCGAASTQRAGARKGGGEQLGYLRGGFRSAVRRAGRGAGAPRGRHPHSARAQAIARRRRRVTGVRTTGGTCRPTGAVHRAPAAAHHAGSRGVPRPALDRPALGVAVRGHRARAAVADIYWTNVCDQDLPFGGIIEHTNLVPRPRTTAAAT